MKKTNTPAHGIAAPCYSHILVPENLVDQDGSSILTVIDEGLSPAELVARRDFLQDAVNQAVALGLPLEVQAVMTEAHRKREKRLLVALKKAHAALKAVQSNPSSIAGLEELVQSAMHRTNTILKPRSIKRGRQAKQ